MKINNYLIAFTGILLFLVFGHIIVIYKYFLVLIHHGLYYCKEMAKSLSLQLPGEYGKILLGMLMLATIITLSRLIATILKVFAFRKTLSISKRGLSGNLLRLLSSLGLQKKVLIFEQSKPQAFCFGFRNPKIYISTGLVRLMNQKELELILRHEKYHLEHRDTTILLLAASIESLFPFFPVVSDLIKVYRTDREVAADKSAITIAEDRELLKNVLRKLIRYKPYGSPQFLPAIISVDTLEARIRSMNMIDTKYKKLGLKNTAVSIFSLIVLVGLMTTPVSAVELHDNGSDVLMLCNGSVICESVCRKQTLQQLQTIQSSFLSRENNFSSFK